MSFPSTLSKDKAGRLQLRQEGRRLRTAYAVPTSEVDEYADRLATMFASIHQNPVAAELLADINRHKDSMFLLSPKSSIRQALNNTDDGWWLNSRSVQSYTLEIAKSFAPVDFIGHSLWHCGNAVGDRPYGHDGLGLWAAAKYMTLLVHKDRNQAQLTEAFYANTNTDWQLYLPH